MSDQFNWDSGQKDGGVSDHGKLTGLGDDDHAQYLNEERHDTPDRHAIPGVVPHDPQKANDSTVVHNTGDESIAGVKTFSSLPVLPSSDPTADNQAASKGYVDKAKVIPFCLAYHNANQTIPNGTTTYLDLNSTMWDNDDMHDDAVNNSRITIKTAGVYLVTANVLFDDAHESGDRAVSIWLNRTDQISQQKGTGTDTNNGRQVSVVYYFDVDDYVEVNVYQASGYSLDILRLGPSPTLSAAYLGVYS